MAPGKQFTITIRKNFNLGKPITFSGRRAPEFAGKLLENAIAMNLGSKAEKAKMLNALSDAISNAEALLAAPQDGKGEVAKKLGKRLYEFNTSSQQLRNKLLSGPMPNEGVYANAAKQIIIGEHITNTLEKIYYFGLELVGASDREDSRMAEKWLHRMKCGQERIAKLSLMLDGLSQGSIWEIKALAENTCTRAALNIAKASNAAETDRLRASASYLRALNGEVAFILETLVPLLREIRVAPVEKIAKNGAGYGKALAAHVAAIRGAIENERRIVSGLPEGSPQLVAFNVFEHHIVNSMSGMIGMLSLAAEMPGRVSEISARSSANALLFIEIIGRVRESDSPGDLELVFRSGDTANYVKALEGKYL